DLSGFSESVRVSAAICFARWSDDPNATSYCIEGALLDACMPVIAETELRCSNLCNARGAEWHPLSIENRQAWDQQCRSSGGRPADWTCTCFNEDRERKTVDLRIEAPRSTPEERRIEGERAAQFHAEREIRKGAGMSWGVRAPATEP